MSREPTYCLTPRHKQIARLASTQGMTRKEIARELDMSIFTLRYHISGNADQPGLFGIVGVRRMVELVIWFWRDGGRALCEEA